MCAVFLASSELGNHLQEVVSQYQVSVTCITDHTTCVITDHTTCVITDRTARVITDHTARVITDRTARVISMRARCVALTVGE